MVSVERRAIVAPAPANQVMRSVLCRSFCEGEGFGGVVQRAVRYPAPVMAAARRVELALVMVSVSAWLAVRCVRVRTLIFVQIHGGQRGRNLPRSDGVTRNVDRGPRGGPGFSVLIDTPPRPKAIDSFFPWNLVAYKE